MEIKVGDKFIDNTNSIITISIITTVEAVHKTLKLDNIKTLNPNMPVYIVTHFDPDLNKMSCRAMSESSILEKYAKIVESEEEAKEVLLNLANSEFKN